MPNSLNIPEDAFEQFKSLCNQLSPENLTGDGEYTKAQVYARCATIKKEWRSLERKICRRISLEQIENEMYKSTRG